MCVNLGNAFPTWLLSPAALLKGMGVKTGVEWLDPAYSLVAKTEEKKDKEKKDSEKTNNEAWQKYYASRDAAAKQQSALVAQKEGGKFVDF